jgi:cytochrome c peroxidase
MGIHLHRDAVQSRFSASMKQNERKRQFAAVLLLSGAVTISSCGGGDDDENAVLDADGCTSAIAAQVDTPVCRGKANFHDRTLAGLGGNGRACSDCHMDSENFQLTPAAAMARFTAMTTTGKDDPLFRPIDANDFRTNGAAARDFTNLTQNGLIRVTIPLPANVRLLDCGSAVPCPPSAQPTSETVADVWRSVPSILDVKITGPDGVNPAWPRGPNQTGGYQLDGRIDTLQSQAQSALRNHAGTTTDPPASFLDDLAAFQNTQFSSAGVNALSAAMTAGTSTLPDPDPVLNALETAGKAIFNRSCAQCHGNMGGHPSGTTPIVQGTQGTPTALVRYHDIATACPRPVDNVSPPRFSFAPCSASQMANVRTYEITNSGTAPSGTPCGGAAQQPACVTRLTTSDPGRLLLTGYPVAGGPGDIQHMDIPNLRGISRTAPYFMNNTAATLEEMLEHYKQFFKRVEVQNAAAPLLTTQPGVTPPVIDRPFTDAEVPALLAYLRKL